MITLPKIVLASGSPRRSEILTSVGWPFEIEVPDIDETQLEGETAEEYVVRLAREKCEEVRSERIVLAADTTVVIEGQVLGKPTDLDDARKMITMLSGNWHEVLTGVAVGYAGHMETGIERTRVKFAAMDAEEIEYLVLNGDPLDKAGAYAVQAQAALFIQRIEGDYLNVVGLPVRLVYEMVTKQPVTTNYGLG